MMTANRFVRSILCSVRLSGPMISSTAAIAVASNRARRHAYHRGRGLGVEHFEQPAQEEQIGLCA